MTKQAEFKEQVRALCNAIQEGDPQIANHCDLVMKSLESTAQSAAPSMRVATMYAGLVPITHFDAVEIHEMVGDPDGQDLIPNDDGSTPTAYSVMLHCRDEEDGGVESIRDFCFDPTEPGAAREAKKAAGEFALSLADMLLASGQTLDPERMFFVGRHFVRDASEETTQSVPKN